MIWQCAAHRFDMSARAYPLVMGILNVTPDSFSDGGLHMSAERACSHARTMIEQGADIIDIGGESTRPGSQEVSLDEELARVLPVVRTLAAEGLVVSIDTRHAEVAQACVKAGAAIVNDVSGFRDPAMIAVVANEPSRPACIVMHMLGEPGHMQDKPSYEDVVTEVGDYLLAQAAVLEEAGVGRDRICIDPGPGFGKTFAHNLALLRSMAELSTLGYLLMAAFSRKAFIGQLTDVSVAAERVAGSVAVAVWAAHHGAAVLRVHDVAPTVQALKALSPLSDVSACL